MYTKEDQLQIEQAIVFLTKTLEAADYNEKPVLLHSIRISMHLYNLGYNKDMVISALFHDLIEDSEVDLKQMEEMFGVRVVQIVKNCTVDRTMSDERQRYMDSFQKAFEDGYESLTVRAVDLIDNSYYYGKAKSQEAFSKLVDKFNYFVNLSKPKLIDGKVWPLLIERQKELNLEKY